MEKEAQVERLKYPIGLYLRQEEYSSEELNSLLFIIKSAPKNYRDVIEHLSQEDLSKTYRPGSWNIRQLVHHVADIQLLHFLRMKKALTESDYNHVTLINMDSWATTVDATSAPTEDSLLMFEGITKRYIVLAQSLTEQQLKIKYFHPVRQYTINQAQAIAMSAWHVRHHLAHINIALG